MFKVWWDFVFGVHKDGFKGIGSFKNDLYTGMLANSFEFFTDVRDIWDRDEDIFTNF